MNDLTDLIAQVLSLTDDEIVEQEKVLFDSVTGIYLGSVNGDRFFKQLFLYYYKERAIYRQNFGDGESEEGPYSEREIKRRHALLRLDALNHMYNSSLKFALCGKLTPEEWEGMQPTIAVVQGWELWKEIPDPQNIRTKRYKWGTRPTQLDS